MISAGISAQTGTQSKTRIKTLDKDPTLQMDQDRLQLTNEDCVPLFINEQTQQCDQDQDQIQLFDQLQIQLFDQDRLILQDQDCILLLEQDLLLLKDQIKLELKDMDKIRLLDQLYLLP